MKFLLTGASVTAQSRTGYAKELIHCLADLDAEFNVSGFGAGHFDDAGFFSLADVVNEAPNILLLEWNTTGLANFNKEKLDLYVSTVRAVGVLPAFIILPRADKNILTDRECEKQLKALADEEKIDLLDLRFSVDVERCVYDGYHTNEVGAKIYAQAIADWVRSELLHKAKLGSSINVEAQRKRGKIALPFQQKYSEPKIVQRKIVITAKAISESAQDFCLSYRAGPFSPVIDFSVFGGVHLDKKASLFDAWCDVERNAFISLFPKGARCPLGAKLCLELIVSDEAPNYSVCRKKDFTYSGGRYIPLSGVYSSGFEVDFISMS